MKLRIKIVVFFLVPALASAVIGYLAYIHEYGHPIIAAGLLIGCFLGFLVKGKTATKDAWSSLLSLIFFGLAAAAIGGLEVNEFPTTLADLTSLISSYSGVSIMSFFTLFGLGLTYSVWLRQDAAQNHEDF